MCCSTRADERARERAFVCAGDPLSIFSASFTEIGVRTQFGKYVKLTRVALIVIVVWEREDTEFT